MGSVRAARLAAALLVLALPAAACTVGAKRSRPTSASTSASKTLVVDTVFDVRTADPEREAEFTGNLVTHALYDTLLTFKGGDVTRPVPLVAASYRVSGDGRTFTFKLRDGVRFSDGTLLTARDVVFSFNRLLHLNGNPSFLLDGVSVAAPDDRTVVLTSATPNPSLPFILANPALGIVSAKDVKAAGGTDAVGADKRDKAEAALNRASAGSGPYVLERFSTTAQIVLRANPRYWGASKPAYARVVIRNVPATAQRGDVQKGDSQLALDLPPAQASGMSGQVNLVTAASPNVVYLVANENPTVSSVTANADFRDAVRYGIDYPSMVKLAGEGAVQAAGVVPSMFLGALPAGDGLRRDLTRTKAAMARSHLSKPGVDLEYPSDLTVNGVAFGPLAERVRADLKEVGITVNLKPAPVATALQHYRDGKEQLGLWLSGPDYPDPGGYLAFLPGGLVGRRAGWNAGAMPSLEALGAKAATTIEAANRAKLYQQIQRALNQHGPFFPVLQPGRRIAAAEAVRGVTYDPTWVVDFASLGG